MRRPVIIDQDTYGPAGTNLQSIALLLNAPGVDVLGLTVVTGDHWRDQQVRHALRLLEIMGRTEVPVVPGAVMPLVNTPAATAAWEREFGPLVYNGAWDLARPGRWADPHEVRDLPEGNPTTAPAPGPAADFIVRLARDRPGEIALWCAAPFTNIALALQLEPRLPELIRELHFMGGAFAPATSAREFKASPRREFNLRFDPEAARLVLRAPWRRVTCSPIDVSQNVRATADLFAAIARAGTPLARYLDRFGPRDRPLWDEVAAATWIDGTLVTHHEELFLDVELDRGPHLGDTLSWTPAEAARSPSPAAHLVVEGRASPASDEAGHAPEAGHPGGAGHPARGAARRPVSAEAGYPPLDPSSLPALPSRAKRHPSWPASSEAGEAPPTWRVTPRPARVELAIDETRFRNLFVELCSRVP